VNRAGFLKRMAFAFIAAGWMDGRVWTPELVEEAGAVAVAAEPIGSMWAAVPLRGAIADYNVHVSREDALSHQRRMFENGQVSELVEIPYT
jgi:hypothetical protein